MHRYRILSVYISNVFGVTQVLQNKGLKKWLCASKYPQTLPCTVKAKYLVLQE